MSELNDKLLEIKRQKDEYILPENLKKDVTVYGVTGTLESGSGGVKLFDTVEHMQQDPSPNEGDLAVVYKEELTGVTEESEFDNCIFPNTVVLSEAFSGNINGSFRSTGGGFFDGMVDMSSSGFRFDGFGDKMIRVEYTSQDGITYTRTDGGEELQEFGITIKYEPMEPWNDVIGNFMKIGGNYFGGVFEYRNDTDSNAFMLNIGPKNSQDYTQGIIYDLEKMNFNVQDVYDVYNVGQNTGNYNLLYAVDSFDNNGCPQTISVYPSYIVVKDMNTNKFYASTGSTFLSTKPTGTAVVVHIDMVNKTYTTETVNYLDNVLLSNNFQGKAYYSNVFAEFSSEYWWFYKKNNNGWVVITDNANFYDQGEVTVPNFFEYKYWNINSQLDTTSDYVYEKTFYGKNGAENGILTTNVSNSFVDVNAEVYTKIQEQYDSMQPRIVANQERIDTSTKCIPCKSDGTPLLDTSNVTNMKEMFYGCKNLITIPLLDTSNVTNMKEMFVNCEKLSKLPLLDTSNVTDMNNMFYRCFALKTIPLLDTSNVINMGWTFMSCGIEELPSLDTSNVTDMSRTFDGCSHLVILPQLDTSSVTSMNNAFYGCTSLSNTSLNNILAMCANSAITSTKTLNNIGLTEEQATICQSLSNYQAFVNAGWTTGY